MRTFLVMGKLKKIHTGITMLHISDRRDPMTSMKMYVFIFVKARVQSLRDLNTENGLNAMKNQPCFRPHEKESCVLKKDVREESPDPSLNPDIQGKPPVAHTLPTLKEDAHLHFSFPQMP